MLKKYFGLFVWTVLPVVVNAQMIQTADIGFRGSDDYIATDISSEPQNPDYSFSLCSTSLAKCVPFNDCKYKKDEIQKRIAGTGDKDLIANFSNHRDGFATGQIDQVFPALKAMLEGIAATCKVDDLRIIQERLHPGKG